MTSFADIIKNKFLEEFKTISVSQLLIALFLAFILGLFIVFVYRVTYSGVSFNRNFALCLVLLSTVTSLVILVISSNIVLSLGMVGALSIVRFRTAVKEPMDTVFMFWAIVAGIITGAGFIPIAIISTLLIGIIFVLVTRAGGLYTASSYLVVIRYSEASGYSVASALEYLPHHRIKSKNLSNGFEELVLETRLSEAQFTPVEALRNIDGVSEVNIISFNSATTL